MKNKKTVSRLLRYVTLYLISQEETILIKSEKLSVGRDQVKRNGAMFVVCQSRYFQMTEKSVFFTQDVDVYCRIKQKKTVRMRRVLFAYRWTNVAVSEKRFIFIVLRASPSSGFKN